MKNHRRLIAPFVLATILLVISARPADAQKDKKLTSTPKTFQTFYAKFKKAVLKRDKVAVASMTSFPFDYGWDAGDEGTYTRSQFISKFNDIFRSTRGLFSRSNPTFSVNGRSFGLYDASDASQYNFAKKGNTYYFTSFVVEP